MKYSQLSKNEKMKFVVRNSSKIIDIFKSDDTNFKYFEEICKSIFLKYNILNPTIYVHFYNRSLNVNFDKIDNDKMLANFKAKYGLIRVLEDVNVKCKNNKVEIFPKYSEGASDGIMNMINEKLFPYVKNIVSDARKHLEQVLNVYFSKITKNSGTFDLYDEFITKEKLFEDEEVYDKLFESENLDDFITPIFTPIVHSHELIGMKIIIDNHEHTIKGVDDSDDEEVELYIDDRTFIISSEDFEFLKNEGQIQLEDKEKYIDIKIQ